MLIETWVAVILVLMIGFNAFLACCGWIKEGERREKAERLSKKLIAENGRLYKIIEHMNGLQTVNAADAFYHKEDKKNV